MTADPFSALFLSLLPRWTDLWDQKRGAPVTNDLGPRCVYLMLYGLRTWGLRARFFTHRERTRPARISFYLFHEDLSPLRTLNKDLKALGIRVIISCERCRFCVRISFCCNIQLKHNKEKSESTRQDRYSIIRMRSHYGCTIKRHSFGIPG